MQNIIIFFIKKNMSTPDFSTLKQVDGSLMQISSGYSGIWGVNSKNEIFYRNGISSKKNEGIDWLQIDGALKDISSGEYGVWGVNSNDEIFCRKGITNVIPQGTNWEKIEGRLMQISSGIFGVWGVNSRNHLYFREGLNYLNPTGSNWTQIDSGFKYISVGKCGVWGISPLNEIFFRNNVTYLTPKGNGWTKIEGTLKQLIGEHPFRKGNGVLQQVFRFLPEFLRITEHRDRDAHGGIHTASRTDRDRDTADILVGFFNLIGKALGADLQKLAVQDAQIRDRVGRQSLQPFRIQGLQLCRGVIPQQGLSDGRTVSRQPPSGHGIHPDRLRRIDFSQIEDVPSAQNAEMAGLPTAVNNCLHDVHDAGIKTGVLDHAPELEEPKAKRIGLGLLVIAEILLIPQRVDDRQESARRDVQRGGKLRERVGVAVLRHQFQH